MKNNINSFNIEDKYSNISIAINTSNIEIKTSDNKDTFIQLQKHNRYIPTIEVKDDILIINQGKKKWYTYLYPCFKIPHIIVNIPKSKLNNLSIKCNTGNIDISAVSFKDINIKQNTGKINLFSLTPNTLTINTRTGKNNLENVIIKEKLHITTNTGKISLDKCDAGEIYIKSNTGNVYGNILTDKAFVIKCKTGKINIPDTFSNNKCEIISNTGNIYFETKKN